MGAGAALWDVTRHDALHEYEAAAPAGERARVRVVAQARAGAGHPARSLPAMPMTPLPPASPSEVEDAAQAHGAAVQTPALIEPFSGRPAGRPACTIIIDDLGDHPELIPLAASIRFPISCAVLPYLPFTRACVEGMRAAGKEILLHLPMEPLSYPRHDPGPLAIFRGMPPTQALSLTERALAEVPEAVGVNNHMGSAATRDAALMRAVLSVVKEGHLFFIDSRTALDSVAYRVAREMGVPAAARTVFLDQPGFDPDFTRGKLRELCDEARRRGTAIGIGHWNEATLSMVRDVTEREAGGDVALVPASALVVP